MITDATTRDSIAARCGLLPVEARLLPEREHLATFVPGGEARNLADKVERLTLGERSKAVAMLISGAVDCTALGDGRGARMHLHAATLMLRRIDAARRGESSP